MQLTIPTSEPVAEERKRAADELLELCRSGDTLTIHTDEEAAEISAMVAELGEQKAELTRMLRSVTDPINAGLKQARALFNPGIKAIEAADKALRQVLATYRLAQFEVAARAREDVADAAAAGDTEALHQALTVASSAPAADASTTTRYRWVVAHVDVDVLPREFLTADTAKLNAIARATSGQEDIMSIPGVTFTREAVVVRRGRK